MNNTLPAKSINKYLLGAVLSLTTVLASSSTMATIVQFETNHGSFEVNLYDQGTPNTVANFLEYVNADAYRNTIIHRSKSNFVIQGGGFAYNEQWPVVPIDKNTPVNNEPVYSNIKGTIAMAKGLDPDGATNQWFFNLRDNTALDYDINSLGYSVFGEVTGDGMAIIEQIAALPTYSDFAGLSGLSALTDLPMQNYSAGDTPDNTNLVVIYRITILDAAEDTAVNLNPKLNTKAQSSTSSSSGGGALSGLLIGLFLFIRLNRRNR